VCIEVSVVFKIITCEYMYYECIVRFGGARSSAGVDLVLGRTIPRRPASIYQEPLILWHSITSRTTHIFISHFCLMSLFFKMMAERKV